MPSKDEFLIGEALLGEKENLAHIDLMIGSKNGPVGQAFANALTQPSAGHGALLAVIRPNLTPKPQTLIIPKVTIGNLEDASKIFGPAQAAIAKAVADSLEEGVIPINKVDDWVIVVSCFIHPGALDYRRIYQYNYSATKLAIKRAIEKYPTIKKIFYDKDRAKHPVSGIKMPRLWRPPYIQVALDHPSIDHQMKVVSQLPRSDRIIIEAGTPLIKKYGMDAVVKLREKLPDVFLVADLKTLDVGKLEVDFAFDATADAVVASGLASLVMLDKFIFEAHRVGIYAYVDMMEVDNPVEKLSQLKEIPDVVILHRGIDTESVETNALQRQKWAWVPKIKEFYKDKKLVSGRDRVLVAVAGGIEPETAQYAIEMGADILIIGRYIASSKDVERSMRNLINVLPGYSEIDLKRIHTDDDEANK